MVAAELLAFPPALGRPHLLRVAVLVDARGHVEQRALVASAGRRRLQAHLPRRERHERLVPVAVPRVLPVDADERAAQGRDRDRDDEGDARHEGLLPRTVAAAAPAPGPRVLGPLAPHPDLVAVLADVRRERGPAAAPVEEAPAHAIEGAPALEVPDLAQLLIFDHNAGWIAVALPAVGLVATDAVPAQMGRQMKEDVCSSVAG